MMQPGRQSSTGACPLLRTAEVLAGRPDPISAAQSRLPQQHSAVEKTITKFSSTRSSCAAAPAMPHARTAVVVDASKL